MSFSDSQRMAFLEYVSFSLRWFFSCLQVSKWPLAGEYFQELCSSKQQASTLSRPLVATPQVAPALTPRLPSRGLPCDGHPLGVCPVATAPLVCARLLVAAHRASARWRLKLHAQPRLIVALCACALPHHTRRAPTPRVLRQWLFLSLASKLDAGGSHGPSRPHPLLPRQHVSTPAHSASTIWPSGCLTTTPRLVLSCHHTLSGPVLSPRCASPSMPSTVCHHQPTLGPSPALLLSARSRSSGMAAP